MKCMRFSRIVVAVVASAALYTAAARSQDAQSNWAVVPAPRREAECQQRHESMNARVKQGNVDLIFIGDSLTQRWEGAGKEAWNKYYGKRNAVNLGIDGDNTATVLWRLDHGNIDGIAPKLAVLMIGTNNSGGGQPPDHIAEGIKAVIDRLRAKSPQTKVLLLGIFPRGADNHDALRQVNDKTNKIISKFADGQNVFYLDVGPKFFAADGTTNKELMPDTLHLSAKGYELWAEAIEPTVAKLMG